MTLQDLIEKLEREWLATDDPAYGVIELAERRGWNLRNRTLVFDFKARQLEATIDAPIDLRIKAALTGFDLSDEEES